MKLDMRGNWLRVLVVPIGVALVASLVTTSAIAAPGGEIGVPQHTWAPGHASNTNSTIQMKWGQPAGTHDGLNVTICDSTWTSINGAHGSIDYSCHALGQFFCIAGASGDIAPTAAEFLSPPSTLPGYLAGSAGGRLLEAHVTCPPPPVCGNGVVEGGTPSFPAEECDDGNTTNGDGCSATCEIEGKLSSIQHIWASTHATNTFGVTIETKFGCNALPVPDACGQYGGSRPLTICGTGWPGLNGQLSYLEQRLDVNSGGEWFFAWADGAFSTAIPDPLGALTPVPPTPEAGRLSNQPQAGYFLEGDNLCLGEAPVPVFSCEGFEPPMDKIVSVKKKNRVLPLKTELLDSIGDPVTDADITSPPIVQILFSAGDPTDPPSEDFLPAGKGDDGNQFVFSSGGWDFNLKSSNFSGPGTYTITMESGDQGEYLIAPTCSATFIIQ